MIIFLNEMSVKTARKVVITGSVAVGKSSIISAVCSELSKKNIKWTFVPEYVDAKEDGLEMLNKYLHDKITAFEFQKYIINYYEWYLDHLDELKIVSNDDIIIFERGVDDSVTCFSNIANMNNKLDTLDLYTLYEKAIDIDKKYNIPSYFVNNNYVFIPIKTTNIDRDGKLISKIIKNTPNENVIIGLYNSDNQCYKRMIERNRTGETDTYTKELIHTFNYNYTQLYKQLMSGEIIRFCSLGKLLDH